LPAGFVSLPPLRNGGFDHGDVHLASQRIFLGHPAEGAVEVIDGQALIGRPEASGVLCAQDEALGFAAARGAGKVLVIDPGSLAVVSEIATGPRPNGLACRWPSGGRALWT